MVTVQRCRERKASPSLGTRATRLLLAWGPRLMCSLTLAAALGGEGRSQPYPLPVEAPLGKETHEPLTPMPPPVEENGLQIQLGERLFHDPQLSHGNRRSCATCHPLDRGGMDGQPNALAMDGLSHLRNTPTIFNVGLNFWFNWDGITHTLEAHTDRLLRNPAVMNTTWPELQGKLGREADYVAAFRAAYVDGLTWNNVIAALVSFERSLVTPSRFDRYLRGKQQALTAEEQRGYGLFKSYGCVACHQGINIGGNMFAKFGVFQPPNGASEDNIDGGRHNVTHRPQDLQVFRVPSLRNVAMTAPYFHNGQAPTLAVAVDTMARVQLSKELTPEEIGLIVQFLQTLTGDYRAAPVRTPTSGGD
ncbi:MAG: cytochrome-c peroxidase [Candidatus Binatia bacterium]